VRPRKNNGERSKCERERESWVIRGMAAGFLPRNGDDDIALDREFIGQRGLHLYQPAINAKRDGDVPGIALGGAGGWWKESTSWVHTPTGHVANINPSNDRNNRDTSSVGGAAPGANNRVVADKRRTAGRLLPLQMIRKYAARSPSLSASTGFS